MMRSRFIPITVLLFLGGNLWSQSVSFNNINANLANLAYSYAAWGDYDHDGDLDVALTGQPGSTIPEMRIYRNDSGLFVDINANLSGVSYSSMEWGDYDNDGDLDLLVTGQDHVGNGHTGIYRNENGIFFDIAADLPVISHGHAAWGDFDNDNDLDILIAGNNSAKILRNAGNNNFTDIDAHLAGVQNAFCSWADYNNDGWLDALVMGDIAGVPSTRLYKNDHGSFEMDSVGFMNLKAGCAKWGDVNNDGKTDLAIAGTDPSQNGQFLIYQNLGNGEFYQIDNYTYNLSVPFIDFGDYDNDGYLDILLMGRIEGCGGTAVTLLYHNESFFMFSDVYTQITGYKNGSVSWGDFNNDGFTDLLFTGLDGFNSSKTEIWRNNSGDSLYHENTSPASPTNLSSSSDGSDVHMAWHGATDSQTPSSGLTYNLYIGTTAGSSEIFSPASILTTGFRKITNLGNANKDTVFTIHDLDAGNYFWSVQAVDNGFMGSAFAIEQSFTIYPVSVSSKENNKIEVFPNPFSDVVNFRNIDLKSASIEIYNALGRAILKTNLSKPFLDLSGLKKGIYVIRIFSGDAVSSSTLLKN
jgi:hypothetical protein